MGAHLKERPPPFAVSIGLAVVLFLGALAPVLAYDLPESAAPKTASSEGDLVSLNLRNVELPRVVELLSHDRGINIVASPQIDKTVTVRLQGVNWKEALAVILRHSGYGFEQVGNIIRIDTLEHLARMPVRAEYRVRNMERADLEAFCKNTLSPPSTYQIVEEPTVLNHRRLLTVVVNAPGPDQEKFKELLSRVDVVSSARPVHVHALSPGGPYAVEIDDMPVARAVEELSREFCLSVVWEDPPKGRACLRMDPVSLNEILEAILAPLKYSFEINGHMLRIGEKARFTAQFSSRLIQLTYANALQVKQLLLPLLSKAGKIEVLGEVKDPLSTDPSISPSAVASVSAARSAVSYSAVPGASPLSPRQRSQVPLVKTGSPSSTLLVSDTPAIIRRILQLVKEIDQPQHLVEINTRLVEVSLNKTLNLGIKWDAEVAANGASGTVVRFPLTQAQVTGNALNNSFTLGTLSAQNFTLLLSALSRTTKMKVLSAPRIATLSHEPARILIGQRFPITVQTNNQQVNILTTGLDYYEEIGIVLTVTPRVTRGQLINLNIKPEVSTIDSLVDNRFPIINTRQAETSLNLRSGHTAIIGGLLADLVRKDQQGLPGLRSIPILGRFFGGNDNTKNRTELIVCVTPRILASGPDDDRLTSNRAAPPLEEVDQVPVLRAPPPPPPQVRRAPPPPPEPPE
jgi:type II secretory pathway component GspD/PulD (secretin)